MTRLSTRLVSMLSENRPRIGTVICKFNNSIKGTESWVNSEYCGGLSSSLWNTGVKSKCVRGVCALTFCSPLERKYTLVTNCCGEVLEFRGPFVKNYCINVWPTVKKASLDMISLAQDGLGSVLLWKWHHHLICLTYKLNLVENNRNSVNSKLKKNIKH